MESDSPQQPRLRLFAQFDPLVVMYRHPVRLCVSLAVPLLVFPELRRFAGWLTGLHGGMAGAVVALAIILLIFLPQFVVSWLDYRHVAYAFYDDRLVFSESFLMRTPIRVYYRSVVGVRLRVNPAQRLRGLADIVITTQVRQGRIEGQAQHFTVPDLTRAQAESVLRTVEPLVAAARAA